MPKKIFKDKDINFDKLEIHSMEMYKDVERGEKLLKLDKVGEMEYTPGEIEHTISSFDEDIEMGRAFIVQEGKVNSKSFTPKAFDVPEPEPVEEEVAEEEIVEEEPAISEEELEAIRQEAYQRGLSDGLAQGRTEGEQTACKSYEAEKADYLNNLTNTYEQVVQSLAQFKTAVDDIDESLPEIIISMVKDIIGVERSVNDSIVVSVTKKSMEHFRGLEKVVFLVNPEDVDDMREAFPDYDTEGDVNVVKGSLKVSTNIGEMSFCIERMMEEFVDKINEEFSQTEEG